MITASDLLFTFHLFLFCTYPESLAYCDPQHIRAISSMSSLGSFIAQEQDPRSNFQVSFQMEQLFSEAWAAVVLMWTSYCLLPPDFISSQFMTRFGTDIKHSFTHISRFSSDILTGEETNVGVRNTKIKGLVSCLSGLLGKYGDARGNHLLP